MLCKFIDALCNIVYNFLYSIPLKRGHFDEDDLRYIAKKSNRAGGKPSLPPAKETEP